VRRARCLLLRTLSIRAALVLAILAGAPIAGAGEPLALADPSPRWVEVRFETSPADQPGRLRGVFGPGLLAWLEPGPRPGQVTVSVPAREVEERLLVGERVVPGSFGDFVWVFDAPSGHVLAASLAGRVVRTLDWGFMRSDAEIEIRVALDTLRPAGFAAATRRLGHVVFSLCTPDEAGCTAVPHVPFDPRTGYVNAVGPLVARTLRIRADNFSPLGEAVFSEFPGSEPIAFAPASSGEAAAVPALTSP
jgi:hypothetical protein